MLIKNMFYNLVETILHVSETTVENSNNIHKIKKQ